MKVLVVGATGTIGKAVCEAMGKRHEVLRIGHTSGDFQVDITSCDSIERLFHNAGSFDALVCTAGLVKFGKIAELAEADFLAGVEHKLMGQVNLVRIGLKYVHAGGSFTLTSGVLAREPMPGSAAIAMVNGGIEAFVRAAALEMPNKVRINAVSPIFVKETARAMGLGNIDGMPASDTALAYVEAVEGRHNGDILDVRQYAGHEGASSVVI
ncbi:MAG TPA: short chain dehydrogenase [Mariprofundaceae bacterium]|nr:short chain dehydrogenase [Mariprofundaceae bacterium]